MSSNNNNNKPRQPFAVNLNEERFIAPSPFPVHDTVAASNGTTAGVASTVTSPTCIAAPGVVTTVEKLGNYSVIDYCSDCVNSARLCS